jgi:hypothetical protein
MTILKTHVAISGDEAMEGQTYKFDTIEHEGQLWLVPQWFEYPELGWMSPVRIILLSALPHQPFGQEFVLTSPLPKSVLDGWVPEGSGYVVVEKPSIRIAIPPKLH